MTGEKSETCLLSVNEGDVKLILINVERRGEVERWDPWHRPPVPTV